MDRQLFHFLERNSSLLDDDYFDSLADAPDSRSGRRNIKIEYIEDKLDDKWLSGNEKAGIIKKGALTILRPLWSGGMLVFFFVWSIRVWTKWLIGT